MTCKTKTFILILLLLFIFSSSGNSNGIEDVVKLSKLHKEPQSELSKAITQMKARKLINVNAMLDYYEAGPNPAHDPPKGRSGGKGGGNP